MIFVEGSRAVADSLRPGTGQTEFVDETVTGQTAGIGRSLADDDRMVHNATQRILESAGFVVIVAEDGQAALELFDRETHHVDLVVSDVEMPRLGGVGLLAALRQRSPDIRALLVSGYADDGLPADLLQGGNTRFLQKPFSLDDLLRAVGELVLA